MRRVCICENVHFRFIYTPSLMKNAPHWHTKFPRFLASPNYGSVEKNWGWGFVS